MKGRAELAAWVDRDALQLTPEGFERQGPVPVIPVACLSRHLFAIANLAFAKMLDAKQNQCIIIRWVRLGTCVGTVGAGWGMGERTGGISDDRSASGQTRCGSWDKSLGVSGLDWPTHVLLCHRRSKKGKGRGTPEESGLQTHSAPLLTCGFSLGSFARLAERVVLGKLSPPS